MPLPRTGMVAPVLFMMKLNSSCGVMSLLVAISIKMLSGFGRVLYVSKEEGYSLSFQHTLARFSMADCGASFQVIDQEDLESLTERLSRPRSPEFVVIDSVQTMGMTYRDYRALKERFRSKLFILVSQVDGKQPDGRPARKMMYDADLKIWVEGYTAFSKGRFIGETGKYIVWARGAAEYWGNTQQEEI